MDETSLVCRMRVYPYGYGPCLAREWSLAHFIHYFLAAAEGPGSGGDL